MPDCHNCPHYLNPRYRYLPWEKTPCATCEPSDGVNHKGRSHVSRDSSDAVTAEESAASDTEQVISDIRLEKLAGFLQQFMSLPSVTRDIVAARFVHPDRPLHQMATRHGITVQAVHSRLKRALERFPVLGEVIAMRTKKEQEEK